MLGIRCSVWLILAPIVIECMKMRKNIGSLRESEESSFLIIRDAFYNCPSATVLAGQQMGIVNLEGAKQLCVSDNTCSYFQWNPDSGSIYLCKDRQFSQAKPQLNWVLGVKSVVFKTPEFETKINSQGICEVPITQKTVASTEEAVKICREVHCDNFSINFNKATATGPGVGPLTGWFCSGHYKPIVSRDGFITMEKQRNLSPSPGPASSLRVPCGLNGPVCSNEFIKGRSRVTRHSIESLQTVAVS